MRSVIALVVVLGCGRGSSQNNAGPPTVAPDEVATPTEQAPPQQAAAPQLGQAVRPPPRRAPAFPATCDAIARDLEKLTKQFAQLAKYRAVDQRGCRIAYEHKTHRPTTRGGWAAGVPEPDPDGIWFYIGIYDPNGPEAHAQIHTQPVVPSWWIGSRKVMFLIREGERTAKAAGAIRKVLERHGLETR